MYKERSKIGKIIKTRPGLGKFQVAGKGQSYSPEYKVLQYRAKGLKVKKIEKLAVGAAPKIIIVTLSPVFNTVEPVRLPYYSK